MKSPWRSKTLETPNIWTKLRWKFTGDYQYYSFYKKINEYRNSWHKDINTEIVVLIPYSFSKTPLPVDAGTEFWTPGDYYRLLILDAVWSRYH